MDTEKTVRQNIDDAVAFHSKKRKEFYIPCSVTERKSQPIKKMATIKLLNTHERKWHKRWKLIKNLFNR